VPAFARQALHAERLGYADPATRKPRQFVSPVPDDLAALVDALRGRKTSG
jgi:23S rRNA pseudouridine1911/1915/1917 synthase